MQGVTLCGNLEFWLNTSPWARFLNLSLHTAFYQCMFNCSKITKNKHEMKKLITDIAHAKNIDGMEQKEIFLQSKISKAIYDCKVTVFIAKKMRFELNIMDKILSYPQKI